MKKIIPFAMIILTMSSCNKYYKTSLANTGGNPSKTIETLKNDGRYFIFRNGSQAFAMDSVSINNKEQTMQCVLNILPDEHRVHLTRGINGKMRYKELNGYEPDVTPVLREVHLYNTPGDDVKPGPFTLSLNRLEKVEIIQKDKKRTASSKTVGVVITTVACVSAFALILGAIAYSSFWSFF